MPPGGLLRIWPVASLLGRSSIAVDTLLPSRLATGQIGSNERMRIYEIDHLAAELSVIRSTNLTPGLLLTPLVVQLSNLTDSRLLKVPEKSGQKISDSDLSGPFHKYGHVRCAQFGLWQGARRAHTPQWVCNRRATQPQAKFGATLRAAVLFRPDFVARSLQIHCGICSSLTPRLAEKSLAANVIVFMFMTT